MKIRATHWMCLLLLVVLAAGTACSNHNSGLADDSELTRLTPSEETIDFDPTWSPDGSEIAFRSCVLDTSNNRLEVRDCGIYVMDADGGDRSRVTTFDAADVSWSPNGDEIIFSTWGYSEIDIMDLSANNTRCIVPSNPEVAALREPSYSPDGAKIVYCISKWRQDSDTSGMKAGGNSQIVVADVDGTNARYLSPVGGNHYSPTWSPDGSQIAFTSDSDGDSEVYVMNPDSSNLVKLTDDAYWDTCPVWSPDGKKIAFISSREGTCEIYVMSSNGGDAVTLTDTAISERSLSWSPDGTKLAIRGEYPDGETGIYVLKVD